MRGEREDQRPSYSLQVVVRETGIHPDTLRVWERRYGLPRPQRTPGGHRLYSRRDIEMIRWLLARQAEGMRIAQAIALWRSLEAAGQDPLRATVSPAPPEVGPASLQALRTAWVEAVLNFNEEEADRIWSEALSLYPVEQVCMDLAIGGVAEIGERWYRGTATVQQEHFASALAARRLSAVIAASPPPSRPERIVVACPPEETHTLPGLLITLILRRRGWLVMDLGANVPLLQMEEALETIQPHLIIMTAQTLYTAATLADAAERVRLHGIRLAFGGRIFQRQLDARRYIPGRYLGDRWEEIPQQVAATLADPHPASASPLPSEYREAVRRYRLHQPMIEIELAREAPEALRILQELDLDLVSPARILEAALRLGSAELAREEIRWLGEFFRGQRMPLDALQTTLRAYAAGLRRIADPGDPLERLARLLEEEAEDLKP
ncbi:MAG: MerR family transcriptional regulator [Anaerolineae bacterium]|uniref:MerR family transcriptional regulator n=1 Tax=Thermoflexus sp. TaxID=1969742 RepID=UPI0025E2F9E7|nr:MerR family transcriptional regulator [Thermoflexus sp.]MDW8179997.1 MerR family transcriptional regulator [Anaerolineae bacterium]MDW8185364.1 MerR family transcriptional regulator [Anaerolineae bacterium]